MIVYHYTTKEAFDQIQRTQNIMPSTPWTAMDATFGIGWYFTDLDPDKCDVMVAFYCWKNTSNVVLQRIGFYLKFEVDNTILKNTREHVYMIEKWDQTLIKYLEANKNKSCSLKPCETCDTARRYRQ